MEEKPVSKVTISLPPALLEFADRLAREAFPAVVETLGRDSKWEG